MLSDALLLRDEKDIDTIRELGLKFPQIISKEKLYMFNSELEEIASQQSKLVLSMTTLMTKSTTAFHVWYQLQINSQSHTD